MFLFAARKNNKKKHKEAKLVGEKIPREKKESDVEPFPRKLRLSLHFFLPIYLLFFGGM